MKCQVRRLAIALAIAGPLAVTATAESSAAPINGMSIKAPAPAVTTDVRYRAYRDYPYSSYYYGYPDYWAYSPYWAYPSYYGYGWW